MNCSLSVKTNRPKFNNNTRLRPRNELICTKLLRHLELSDSIFESLYSHLFKIIFKALGARAKGAKQVVPAISPPHRFSHTEPRLRKKRQIHPPRPAVFPFDPGEIPEGKQVRARLPSNVSRSPFNGPHFQNSPADRGRSTREPPGAAARDSRLKTAAEKRRRGPGPLRKQGVFPG